MAAHGSLEPFVLVRVQVGEQKGLCLGGYSDPPRHDRSESTYSYWHPLGYGSSESIAYDRNLAVRTAFLRDLLDSTVQGGNRLC